MNCLDLICGSRVISKSLAFFSNYPKTRVTNRALAKNIHEDPGALWYKLKALSQAGIITKSKINGATIYQANPKCNLLIHLKELANTPIEEKA